MPHSASLDFVRSAASDATAPMMKAKDSERYKKPVPLDAPRAEDGETIGAVFSARQLRDNEHPT